MDAGAIDMKYDAVIIGAGPAGASCAIWMQQLGFKPVLVEKNDRCGGLQLSNPYTNTWIASSHGTFGKDVANSIHENVLQLGVPIHLGRTASAAHCKQDHVLIELDNSVLLKGRYLVLATGVTVRTGGFIERAGLIVGPGSAVAKTRFEDSRVAILGGGDSAYENYHMAKSRGAASVTIFARTVRARNSMRSSVPDEDVVVGEPRVDDKNQQVNGRQFDHILVLYGFEAGARSTLGLDLAMKPSGFIATDENCQTSNELVYAVGEVAQRAHPCCVTSMADGVVAAKAMQGRIESSGYAKIAGTVRRAIGLGLKL